MGKRVVGIFSVMILAFSLVLTRLYYITGGQFLAMAAERQSSFSLKVATSRGIIYDCNMKSLVEQEEQYLASVLPTPQAVSALKDSVEDVTKVIDQKQIQSGRPILTLVSSPHIYSPDIEVFTATKRYSDDLLCPHLIGYVNGDPKTGVTGIEKSYNSLLEEYSGDITVRYQVDALGNPLTGVGTTVEKDSYGQKGGVVLTIDSKLQKIVQDIANEDIPKGAVVVMDPYSGDIKALASTPSFNPNKIADYLNDPDSPLINRAFYSYNVGSTFKIVTAAAALEQGIPTTRAHICTGSIDIDGQVFSCNKKSGHGELDLKGAIEHSCNTYFIDLAKDIGGGAIRNMAKKLGFGQPAQLAEGMASGSGNLPTDSDLNNIAEVANFGFGQGVLMATPIQVSQMICTVANGGSSVTPRLVLGTTLDGASLDQKEVMVLPTTAMKERTAELLRKYMVSVVENGSGSRAKPDFETAGGKTATAQTGRFIEGKEQLQAWFAGFYPGEHPKYVITVLVEGGGEGSVAAAPIFKRICDMIQAAIGV